jgi:hypothetical protein
VLEILAARLEKSISALEKSSVAVGVAADAVEARMEDGR